MRISFVCFLLLCLIAAPTLQAQGVSISGQTPYELAAAAEKAEDWPEALYQYRLAAGGATWGHAAAWRGTERMEKKLSLPPNQPWITAGQLVVIFYGGLILSLLAGSLWSLRLFYPHLLRPIAWQIPLGLTMVCLALLVAQAWTGPRGSQALIRLEVRSGPGESFPLKGELPQASLVQVSKNRAGWIWIEQKGLQGWVREESLRPMVP